MLFMVQYLASILSLALASFLHVIRPPLQPVLLRPSSNPCPVMVATHSSAVAARFGLLASAEYAYFIGMGV